MNYLKEIKTHFPQLKWAKAQQIKLGMDHVVFMLDKKIIFRFPKDEEYRKTFCDEVALMKLLGKKLSTQDHQLALFGTPGQFKIIDGPGKFDLSAALFLGPAASGLYVTFEIEDCTGERMKVQTWVSGVKAKNWAEDKFEVEGSMNSHDYRVTYTRWDRSATIARYCIRDRSGTLTIAQTTRPL